MIWLQTHDAVYRWLSSVRLERYYQLFADAGYDLPTVSRMTPEVLLYRRVMRKIDRKL